MPQTQTMIVSLPRLCLSEDRASIVVRLMMAANDIALANKSLADFKKEQPRIRRHVQRGAAMYFVRLQCGHLNEAMKIVREVKDNPYLMGVLGRCSHDAQDAFGKLEACLDGAERAEFQRYIARIRHQTAFHYDGDAVLIALRDRASRPEAARSRITWGDDLSLWRFELADDIADSIICRQIWAIPREATLREEADRISDYGSDLCKAFLDFSGEFVFRYVREHAAI